MKWIGIKGITPIADVEVYTDQYSGFRARFNREVCDKICPNNRRIAFGIDGNRLYFKECNGDEGYKYVYSSSERIGIAHISCSNADLYSFVTDGKKNTSTGFTSDLMFDEKFELYYIEKPKLEQGKEKKNE